MRLSVYILVQNIYFLRKLIAEGHIHVVISSYLVIYLNIIQNL